MVQGIFFCKCFMIGRRVSLWEYEAHVTRPLLNWRNAIWRILGDGETPTYRCMLHGPQRRYRFFFTALHTHTACDKFSTQPSREKISDAVVVVVLVHIGGSLQYYNYYCYSYTEKFNRLFLSYSVARYTSRYVLTELQLCTGKTVSHARLVSTFMSSTKKCCNFVPIL